MPDATDQKLSAFIDGDLSPAEVHAVERRLASDPLLAAQFDGLKRANALARDYFQSVLSAPVPLSLARVIEGGSNERLRQPVISDAPKEPGETGFRQYIRPLRALAAGLALLLLGAAGGYMAATWPQSGGDLPSAWLADIADYHRVYAAEKRHLVEVPASEKDHIETWLTKVVGVPVVVPDLSGQGLTFAGGRLLVADSKPVAQLMYRRDSGTVVALCLSRRDAGESQAATDQFAEVSIAATRLVSWWDADAKYVVIGDAADTGLASIARAVALLG